MTFFVFNQALHQRGAELVLKQKMPPYRAAFLFGGEWGIRTRGPFNKSTVFKTAAIDHSANSPRQKYEKRGFSQTIMYERLLNASL